MDNLTILLNYCQDKLSKNNYFNEYINNNPSFVLTFLEDRYIPFELKQNIKISLKLQQMKFQEFHKQIKEISMFSDEIIGLKGYFLQKKYYPSEYIRLFNDIDVLVMVKDSYSFYKVAKKNGYSFVQQKSILYRCFCNDFMSPLFKVMAIKPNVHVQFKKSGYQLLEMHSDINKHRSVAYQSKFNIEKMFMDAEVIDFGDFKFKMLSPEDNLIYLMFHTIKHLCYIELYGNSISVNLQRFYDVAQVINNENIDWDLFYCKAINYEVFPYILLFIKMFNDIYNNMIPMNIYNKLIHYYNLNTFKGKSIFDKVISLSSVELIIGDYRRLPEIMEVYEKAKKVKNPGLLWEIFFINNNQS